MAEFKLVKTSNNIKNDNLKCSLCHKIEPYTDLLKFVNTTHDNIINKLKLQNKFICLSCRDTVKTLGNFYNEL